MLNIKQQNKVIKRVIEEGYPEEAELLKNGSLWEAEDIIELIEEMREEGLLSNNNTIAKSML